MSRRPPHLPHDASQLDAPAEFGGFGNRPLRFDQGIHGRCARVGGGGGEDPGRSRRSVRVAPSSTESSPCAAVNSAIQCSIFTSLSRNVLMAAASALGSTHLSTRLKAPLASCRRQCLPGLIARLLVTAATYLTRRFRGFGDGAALRGTPAAAPASSARQAAVARTGPRRGEQALASCATPSCRRWGGTRPGNKAKGWAGRPSACGVARASFRPLIRVRAQQRLVYVSPPRCERDVDGGRAHASDGELHVCERHLRVCTRRRGTIRPATERNGAVGRQRGAREAGDRD